jgi:hypothetical protein
LPGWKSSHYTNDRLSRSKKSKGGGIWKWKKRNIIPLSYQHVDRDFRESHVLKSEVEGAEVGDIRKTKLSGLRFNEGVTLQYLESLYCATSND